jgi:hypothetical protein
MVFFQLQYKMKAGHVNYKRLTRVHVHKLMGVGTPQHDSRKRYTMVYYEKHEADVKPLAAS